MPGSKWVNAAYNMGVLYLCKYNIWLVFYLVGVNPAYCYCGKGYQEIPCYGEFRPRRTRECQPPGGSIHVQWIHIRTSCTVVSDRLSEPGNRAGLAIYNKIVTYCRGPFFQGLSIRLRCLTSGTVSAASKSRSDSGSWRMRNSFLSRASTVHNCLHFCNNLLPNTFRKVL